MIVGQTNSDVLRLEANLVRPQFEQHPLLIGNDDVLVSERQLACALIICTFIDRAPCNMSTMSLLSLLAVNASDVDEHAGGLLTSLIMTTKQISCWWPLAN
jgi:hypothetical protein